MKTLLIFPLFFLSPVLSAFAAKSYDVPAETGGGAAATAAAPTTRSEPDGAAKKTPATPAPAGPGKTKRTRTAAPAYLFME